MNEYTTTQLWAEIVRTLNCSNGRWSVWRRRVNASRIGRSDNRNEGSSCWSQRLLLLSKMAWSRFRLHLRSPHLLSSSPWSLWFSLSRSSSVQPRLLPSLSRFLVTLAWRHSPSDVQSVTPFEEMRQRCQCQTTDIALLEVCVLEELGIVQFPVTDAPTSRWKSHFQRTLRIHSSNWILDN